MEFNEKLQLLRKQKGLTQEELAEFLHVSRAAISKWESGRGYPNIDSLKTLSTFFSISIDDLLSTNEVLTIAEEDQKQELNHYRHFVFGTLDCCTVLLFFLPFFTQKLEDKISAVPLPALIEISNYLKNAYIILLIGMLLCGTFLLAVQNYKNTFRSNHNLNVSFALNTLFVLLLIGSLQPYAASFLFTILICKFFILIRWK